MKITPTRELIMKIIPSLTLSILLCSSVATQAADSLIYGFNGQSLSPTATPAYLDATNISFGSTGFATNTTVDLGNPAPGILANADTELNARTAADALTKNDYISFTITPDVGTLFDATGLKIDALALNGSAGLSGSTTEYSFGLYSSMDGWASTSDMIGSPQSVSFTSTANGRQLGNWTTQTFDITSLTGLSEDTEFRLYVWVSDITGTTPNNNRRLALDNITLFTIPEPSSLALTIAGFAVLTTLARRRS